MLGVKNVQFSLNQGIEKSIYSILQLATRYDARSRKVTLEHAFFFLSVWYKNLTG